MIMSKKLREGGTIVEVIVALVLFATFIAGAVKVILAQRQLSDKARAHYTAINLCKNQIELIRNLRRSDYDQLLAMEEAGVRVNAEGIKDENGKFKRFTTITPDPNNDYRLEAAITVKIINPITLEFGNENEHLTSYISKQLKR